MRGKQRHKVSKRKGGLHPGSRGTRTEGMRWLGDINPPGLDMWLDPLLRGKQGIK